MDWGKWPQMRALFRQQEEVRVKAREEAQREAEERRKEQEEAELKAAKEAAREERLSRELAKKAKQWEKPVAELLQMLGATQWGEENFHLKPPEVTKTSCKWEVVGPVHPHRDGIETEVFIVVLDGYVLPDSELIQWLFNVPHSEFDSDDSDNKVPATEDDLKNALLRAHKKGPGTDFQIIHDDGGGNWR